MAPLRYLLEVHRCFEGAFLLQLIIFISYQYNVLLHLSPWHEILSNIKQKKKMDGNISAVKPYFSISSYSYFINWIISSDVWHTTLCWISWRYQIRNETAIQTGSHSDSFSDSLIPCIGKLAATFANSLGKFSWGKSLCWLSKAMSFCWI